MIHEEETFEIIRNSKVDLENLSLKVLFYPSQI